MVISMMNSTTNDPLALRHGALISQVWDQIGQARSAATAADPKPAYWLRRMRNLKRHVLIAQRAEVARNDFAAVEVNEWFAHATDALSRAESHFQNRVKSKHYGFARQASDMVSTFMDQLPQNEPRNLA